MSRNLYLALGDSVTAGVGSTSKENSYVHLVGEQLIQSKVCSETTVLTGTNWTTEHLLRAVRLLPSETWDAAGIVTVLIGGNDLRRRYYSILSLKSRTTAVLRAADNCAHTLLAIMDIVKERGVPHAFVQTLYNPLPNSRCATTAIQRLNHKIQHSAAVRGYHVIDLYPLFVGREGELIHHYRTGHLQDLANPYDRPVHPNDEGHTLIAEEVHRQIMTVIAQG